jgi:hypothetical protein
MQESQRAAKTTVMTDGGAAPVMSSESPKTNVAPADPPTHTAAATAIKPVSPAATAAAVAFKPVKASTLNQHRKENGASGGPGGLGTTYSRLGQDQVCPLTQVVSVLLDSISESMVRSLCCLAWSDTHIFVRRGTCHLSDAEIRCTAAPAHHFSAPSE